ncbi:hypothetical protein PENTCL1PPCAC_24444, partial [Pristionchus entomophagus]
MAQNASLRYGFEWDREYFINAMMKLVLIAKFMSIIRISSYHFFMPIVTSLTLHPGIMYLLLFESTAMRKDIRRGYIFTHLSLILNEWTFCFLFRIYPLIPFAALYCEGPLCRAGMDKQILLILLSIPVILINPPFNFLVMRMHQMLVPQDKYLFRTQILLGITHSALMITNMIGFGVFGRDHDRVVQLMKEPELAWITSRGGTIFFFGPPGDPQYFKWELLTFLVSMSIIAPPLVLFTADSMNIIAATNDWMGATLYYIIPLSCIFSFMFIDTSSIPGWIYAPLRILVLIVFTLNGHQFGALFIAKNPAYRKMAQNASLRYGFDWDCDYFLDFTMRYHFCMPIVTMFTLHPMVFYLLFFESNNMRTEIRRGYIFTHVSANEWSFCFFLRIYTFIPYAALYCEGPLCQMGIDKQILMTILSIPVVLINPPFNFLLMRLHQMLVPNHCRWKLSTTTQCLLGVVHTSLMIANVVGFGVFGRDHHRAQELEQPELAWLKNRGGTILLFGPPGDPQYFKWELYILGFAILVISPPLIHFTAESIKMISRTNDWMGATVHYIIPLSYLLLCMIIDTTSIPGWFYAPSRCFILTLFTLNSLQFCMFFIFKNPKYRQ